MFIFFFILNDAVTVPLNTHICSMHEQRALRWANNRIRAKAYRRGGYFSVHTAHDTRSVETKNPCKKSLLPGFEATPVTQRWHLGYNFSACLRGVRARAQRCKGRARAGECSAGFCFWNLRLSPSSLDPSLFIQIHKTALAASNRSSDSPVPPPPSTLNQNVSTYLQLTQSSGVTAAFHSCGGSCAFWIKLAGRFLQGGQTFLLRAQADPAHPCRQATPPRHWTLLFNSSWLNTTGQAALRTDIQSHGSHVHPPI